MIGEYFRTAFRIISVISLTLSLVPITTTAQTDAFDMSIRNIENAVLIVATPAIPVAGQTVHLKAESPIIDLAESDVTWQVAGKVVAQGVGVSEIDVTVGQAGESIDADVTVVHQGWGRASKSISIVPIQLDLLFDAPTYVPPFYRGRALPSVGTQMRLQAIARFPKKSGGFIADADITYTWSRNGQILGSLSGIGKSFITVDAPALYSTDTITVKATASGGTISATESISVPSRDAYVALYQDHPTFGIMYHKMTPTPSTVSENEMTFVAIPYFASAESREDASLRYQWNVNGAPVTTAPADKSRITVRARASDSVANISLEVSHLANIFMSAVGSWSITFGGKPQDGGTSGTNDVFHPAQ